MDFSLQNMPDHARLWVYQSNRKFSQDELDRINTNMSDFVSQWRAHGAALSAGFDIFFDQVLVLAVDESQHGATGCSIDDSVRLVKSLENELGVSMTDRTAIAFVADDQLELRPMLGLKKAVQEGEITKEAIVLNNSVASYGDFRENWKQEAQNSWLKRYFE